MTVFDALDESMLRPNDDPVPDHWVQCRVREHVQVKNYAFTMRYIVETAILFAPLGIADISNGCER